MPFAFFVVLLGTTSERMSERKAQRWSNSLAANTEADSPCAMFILS